MNVFNLFYSILSKIHFEILFLSYFNSRGLTPNYILNIPNDEDGVDVFIEPPDVNDLTDEDSGDDDGESDLETCL